MIYVLASRSYRAFKKFGNPTSYKMFAQTSTVAMVLRNQLFWSRLPDFLEIKISHTADCFNLVRKITYPDQRSQLYCKCSDLTSASVTG
jgi:hypothetical protein